MGASEAALRAWIFSRNLGDEVPSAAGFDAVWSRRAPARKKPQELMKLLGTTYKRDEVVSRYMAEYLKYGHIPNTSWVKPTPPPQENDPMFRLPVLQV